MDAIQETAPPEDARICQTPADISISTRGAGNYPAALTALHILYIRKYKGVPTIGLLSEVESGMIMEGILTFIIVGALFMVAPGILATVQASAPTVNATLNPTLATSQTSINTIVAGGLNLSAIAVIMLGIGLMIAGFLILRPRQQ